MFKKYSLILLFFLVFSSSKNSYSVDIFAYITNSGDGTVSVINTATNLVVATVTVGDTPWGVAISPDGLKVYVTNFSGGGAGSVSVINASTNLVTATITVQDGPRGVVFNPAGTRAYVVNSFSATVSEIDPSTDTVVDTFPTTGGGSFPYGVTINSSGTKLYVALSSGSAVDVIDTTSKTIDATVLVAPASSPYGIAILPDDSKVYGAGFNSGRIAVIDTTNNTLLTTILTGGGFPRPFVVNVSPDGSTVYAANFSANTLSVIDPVTDTITNAIAVVTGPFGVSLTPDSSTIYVANASSNNVAVIDAVSQTITTTIPVGGGPRSLGSFITPLPDVSLNPTSLTFSSQTVGTSSSAQAVTLTNPGNGLLAISSITASGDYSQTNNCGASLPAYNSCTISVVFTPTATGTRSGAITILTNATDPSSTVSLTGEGTSSGGNTVTIDVPGGTTIQANNTIQDISLIGTTNLTDPTYQWEIVSTSIGDLSNAGTILNATSSTATYQVPRNAITQTVTLKLTVTGTSDSLNAPISAATSTLSTTTQLNIVGDTVVDGSGCSFHQNTNVSEKYSWWMMSLILLAFFLLRRLKLSLTLREEL